MTLSDLEGHFAVTNLLRPELVKYTTINYYLVFTERLVKVAGSRVHCKSGNISEIVQDRDFDSLILHITKCDMAYRITLFSPMFVSDLQGHLPVGSHFKCDFFCTAVQ